MNKRTERQQDRKIIGHKDNSTGRQKEEKRKRTERQEDRETEI